MAVRRLDQNQPESFTFAPDNLAWANQTIAKYPAGKQASAVIPLLWRAQEQNAGWLSEPAMRYVGDMLDMAYIRVYEVATFYTMFQLHPVGRRAHLQVCGTTPCMLRGSEDLMAVCRNRIHPDQHHVSADGNFSWEEAECLGACVNAPLVQIWSDTYEDLTPERLEEMLDMFARGEGDQIKPGPQIERQFGAPFGGATTLTDPSVFTRNRGSAKAQPPAAPVATTPGRPNDEPLTVAATKGPVQQRNEQSASAVLDSKGKAAATPPSTSAATSAAPAVDRKAEDAAIKARLDALPADASAEDKANAAGTRPAGLAVARAGKADDLKRIRGIGRVNEDKLNDLGIWHFDQIAGWTRAEIAWVGVYLAFPGRIDRENWLEQAAVLARGGDTDFSKRVDAGDVESSKDES